MYPSRWKLAAYAILVALGCLIAIPNLLPPTLLSGLPRVALGLDLRGGSHLVLAADRADVLRDRLDGIADDARAALSEAGIPDVGIVVGATEVTLTFVDDAQRHAAEDVLRGLISWVPPPGLSTPQPDQEIMRVTAAELRIRPTDAAIDERLNGAISQSRTIIERRVNEWGVAEPTVQRMGADRILVQLPGVQDPEAIKRLLVTTAKMTFHLVVALPDGGAAAGDRMPENVEIVPSQDGRMDFAIMRGPLLRGDRLVDAAAGFDERTGQPIVSFRLDAVGARQFAAVTRAHVGTPFAIVLDGKVLSAPVIREPIIGGSGQISGGFTAAEAAALAAQLRAGALPIDLHIVEERTVGPDLGADAIRAGAIAGAAGFALVFGFMVILYGRWGLVANLALAVNVVLTFAVLSLLRATLTLPGIAGIVLGIGLAVDANILINERIKEETRKGRSAAAALDAGFRRAYRAIVDSNLTTLIATALLFGFGSGAVRGFAVTMAIGIATSMFTAVAVVRAWMATWLRIRRPARLTIRPLWSLGRETRVPHVQFMRARFFGIGLSAILSLASLALFVHPGLNYGIDFTGGTLLEVKATEAVDLAALRSHLKTLPVGDVALQEFGDAASVLIRLERQPGGEAAQAAAAARVKAGIADMLPDAAIVRVETVGPTVSGEFRHAGILATSLAGLAMTAYIWVRFEWPFAVGAMATLVLDVTKTLGFLALTGMEFNLAAIAAVLTLIGYSVNDKVVVYDRMRENLRGPDPEPLRELIDASINQTLARSLYTSATAFLALVPMAVWGGAAVASFARPMLFGIVIAASSSVFIAAPILLLLGRYLSAGHWRKGGAHIKTTA